MRINLILGFYPRKEVQYKTNKEIEYLLSEKVRNELFDLEVYFKVRHAAWLEVDHQIREDLED